MKLVTMDLFLELAFGKALRRTAEFHLLVLNMLFKYVAHLAPSPQGGYRTRVERMGCGNPSASRAKPEKCQALLSQRNKPANALTSQPFTKANSRLAIVAMKIVIGGSTGFVGEELVRQALSHPAVTSIVAFSRRETPVPPDADSAKLTSVICDDFASYSDSVKNKLEDADACIWYDFDIFVVPSVCLPNGYLLHPPFVVSRSRDPPHLARGNADLSEEFNWES
jgi:hypothetical protein